jgi:hypothetical protein
MARKKKTPDGYVERLTGLASSRLGRCLLAGVLVAIVLLGVGMIVKEARAYAHALPRYRIHGPQVRFVDLPRALGPLAQQSLESSRWLRLDVSVFDANAEQKIRDLVSKHPMVESVRAVDIHYPSSVEVRVAVRRPAAWVRVGGPGRKSGWLLVSSDARLLDPKLYGHYLRRRRVPLPKLVGIDSHPPRFAGQAWEDIDEQVAEGLAAADVSRRLYRDLNGRVYVDTIDVRDFPAPPERRRHGEVRLKLQDGRVVEWGRTERALEGVAGEDAYATKLRRLERQLLHGPLGQRLDVRYRLSGEGRSAR